jgi:hypothetical protein
LYLRVAERFDTIANVIELGYELKIYIADKEASDKVAAKMTA